jgi:protein-tyrosine phosphatase
VIDLHCHILPGLDDGPPDLEGALAMARLAAADGVTAVVATPHVFDGRYETTRAAAEAALARLRAAIAAERISLEVHLGSDCRLDERLFDPARRADVLTIAGGRYLLIEFPHEMVPPCIEASFFRLRAAGIEPVLTHPERNRELQGRGGIARLEAWVAAGLPLQVTGESLTGGFGREAGALGAALVRRGLCHVVASDGHSAAWRPPVLAAARAAVERLAGAAEARRLFEENPRRALASAPLAGAAPACEASRERPPARRRFLFWT